MPAFTKFHDFLYRLGNKEIDLNSDAFKAYLSNAAPDAANHSVKADIAEIAAGNGYVAGGQALTVSWTETAPGSGIWRWSFVSPAWTAAGGAIASHRYLIVYDDTHVNDALVGFVDRGAAATVASGTTRLWDFGTTGAFDLS